jgi:ABC-type sugar transport system permease subunit
VPSDRALLGLFVGLPLALEAGLIWAPAIASIGLAFTDWNGVRGLDAIRLVGLDNFVDLFTAYPPFWPALLHTLVWLAVLLLVAVPLGVVFAALVERRVRGARFAESALFLPVVLSPALIGLVWELLYAPDQGFLNSLLGTTGQGRLIDWLGDPSLNLWAVLVAAVWRHVGYVMVLYLAGLRSVDPAMREAAALEGANDRQIFLRVVLPVLRPVNVVVVVVTAIEALRAFDLVYVINRGMNGLEVLPVLVTNNIVGEAPRVGFGSAIATVLLTLAALPIVLFVRRGALRDRR